jgi:hypothetical protein
VDVCCAVHTDGNACPWPNRIALKINALLDQQSVCAETRRVRRHTRYEQERRDLVEAVSLDPDGTRRTGRGGASVVVAGPAAFQSGSGEAAGRGKLECQV